MHARPRRGFGAIVGGAFASLGVLVACGDPDPAEVRIELAFPSPQLAIASTDVEFIVYDDPEPGACERIYLKRLTNDTSGLPKVILQRRPTQICDVVLGRITPLDLPLGKHSVLVATKRDNNDFLVGCSDVTVTPDTTNVRVNLALPGSVPLPTLSTCQSLQTFCTDPKACQ